MFNATYARATLNRSAHRAAFFLLVATAFRSPITLDNKEVCCSLYVLVNVYQRATRDDIYERPTEISIIRTSGLCVREDTHRPAVGVRVSGDSMVAILRIVSRDNTRARPEILSRPKSKFNSLGDRSGK